MTLSEYIKDTKKRSQLIKNAAISNQFLYQISIGLRPVPVAKCVAIEKATNGEVTRKDLRPNDWHLIWPELIDK